MARPSSDEEFFRLAVSCDETLLHVYIHPQVIMELEPTQTELKFIVDMRRREVLHLDRPARELSAIIERSRQSPVDQEAVS